MSSFDWTAIAPYEIAIIVGLAVVVGVTAIRAVRARRRPRRRVVEQPNSHYTSQLARNSESRHRWSNIALDGIHEVNRGEVERLLAKIEATSVDALRPNERTFLDRMAEIAGTRPSGPPAPKDRQAAPDLRHRPA